MNPSPFQCTYTPNIPELLIDLGCSIAISTYQAGKLIFLSPRDREFLLQLPRTFDKPMGIAFGHDGNDLALATKGEVIRFRNSNELARHYPKAPETYDTLYMPMVTYKTSYLDIHDLEFGHDGLYAVNTLFSCISKIDGNYHFTPVWKPPFISDYSSEDRCHLNGMVMENGRPKYVTAFGTGNTMQSWKSRLPEGGVIIDVDSGELVATDLAMPHSPRLINGELYVLLSATGELARIDFSSGKNHSVLNLGGFVRGMAYHRDFLFIGLSKIRQNSSSFGKLPIAAKASSAGIAVVHLPSMQLWGEIRYETSVDEIYDVRILPGKQRPNILNENHPFATQGIMTPENTYWAKNLSTNLQN